MAKKSLRLPKGDEWTDLPTSKAKALKLGLNRFIPEDGQLREIRRFGSKLYPNGKVELWSSRASNRGGGSSGSRQQNEELSTPPWADKTSYNKSRANANAMGLDADHIRTIARTAEGIRWLESTGRGDRDRLWDSYERAGLPLGNQAGNIAPEDPNTNQFIIPAEYNAMDNAIANATGGYDPTTLLKRYVALDKRFGILDQINSLIAWRKGENAMSDFLNASLDGAADAAGPVGQIAEAAFTELVDEPVRQATGEGVFDAIPNGSQEERRAENRKINGDLKKNSSRKGNGAAHSISNEIEYMAKKFANGQLPYNGD